MTAATDTQTTKARKPLRGKLIGTVISDRRNQTRTVAVNYVAKHPRYTNPMRKLPQHHGIGTAANLVAALARDVAVGSRR